MHIFPVHSVRYTSYLLLKINLVWYTSVWVLSFLCFDNFFVYFLKVYYFLLTITGKVLTITGKVLTYKFILMRWVSHFILKLCCLYIWIYLSYFRSFRVSSSHVGPEPFLRLNINECWVRSLLWLTAAHWHLQWYKHGKQSNIVMIVFVLEQSQEVGDFSPPYSPESRLKTNVKSFS